MSKKEQEEPKEILTEVGGLKTKFILTTEAEKLAAKKRINKLDAMKIAMTYIQDQRMRKMTPEKAMEIAGKFLVWLEK